MAQCCKKQRGAKRETARFLHTDFSHSGWRSRGVSAQLIQFFLASGVDLIRSIERHRRSVVKHKQVRLFLPSQRFAGASRSFDFYFSQSLSFFTVSCNLSFVLCSLFLSKNTKRIDTIPQNGVETWRPISLLSQRVEINSRGIQCTSGCPSVRNPCAILTSKLGR